MFTACGFWMRKITTTMRAAKPAISPLRIPLMRVRLRPRGDACGAGGGGGLEPLADEGGSVLAVPYGAAGSVMVLLPLRMGPGC